MGLMLVGQGKDWQVFSFGRQLLNTSKEGESTTSVQPLPVLTHPENDC